MSTWMKLSALLRGETRRAVEQVTDRHALLILEQEIHDAEQALHEARHHLTHLMAERTRLQRQVADTRQKHTMRTEQARAALLKGEEALALEVADIIAHLERMLQEDEARIARLAAQETRLKQRLREAATTIQDHRRELDMLQATASAHRATALVSANGDQVEGRITAMRASVARIRARQSAFEDRETAWEDLTQDAQAQSLDVRLAQAGLAPLGDAASVLARLRGEMSPP